MKQDKVALLFEDLSINSVYQFLEEGKDDEVLREIAYKRGITLPSKDIAIFKGKYAFVDEKDENHDMYPEFNGAIFCGNGVIQDGNIITSGTCPWMAKLTGHKDGTAKLTHADKCGNRKD